MILLELFLGFLEVGLFSFGGAYGAIPLIRDVVLRYGWLDEATLTQFIAVCESTPGPIMVNMATYIGSSQAGIPGALVATGTVVLPAFLIILLVTRVMDKFLKNPWVKAIMKGLAPCVVGIIIATGLTMLLGTFWTEGEADLRALAIAALLGAGLLIAKLLKKKLSPIALILLSGVLGVIFYGLL